MRNSINFVTAFVIAITGAVAAFVRIYGKRIKRHFITRLLVSYTIAFIVCTLKVVRIFFVFFFFLALVPLAVL